MAEGKPPFYSASFPDVDFKPEFSTADDLSNWLQDRKQEWAPIFQINVGGLSKPVRGVFEQTRARLQHLFDIGVQYAQSKDEITKAGFSEALRQVLTIDRIPLDQPGLVSFLVRTAERYGPNVGAAALVGLGHIAPDRPFNLQSPESRLGVLLVQLFQLGIHPDTPVAVAESLRVLASDYRADIEAAAKQLRNQTEEIGRAAQRAVDSAAVERAKDRAAADQALAEFEVRAEEATASLRATEKAYNEQMRLHSSVQYWTDEAKRYKRQSRYYLAGTIFYIGIAGTIGFKAANSYIPELLKVSPDVAALAVGVTATITLLSATVAFWIGRVLVRLYLSSHHLFIAAGERAVMIQTFLALVKDGKLEPDERTLVLSPLFRPSTDGIVKEDTTPDLSAAGHLAKLLDKR